VSQISTRPAEGGQGSLVIELTEAMRATYLDAVEA
jgi:hypothetical protein